jgi:hypothetical protein
MLQTDTYGFQYYEHLPEGAFLARNIWKFVTIDPDAHNYYRVNIGMKYLIFAEEHNRYELYQISEYTRDKDLLNYIKQQRLFYLPLSSIS